MRSLSRLGRISGLVTALTFAACVLLPRAAAAQEITEQARQHFRAGVSFLQDPDGARYEEAYREFKAAYADSPSWKILGNLGLCAMKLERDGEAIDAYEKYIAQGADQIDPAEKGQVERDLQSMKAGVVTLSIEATPGGALLIDERVPNRGGTVVNNYGTLEGPVTLRVRPGVHRLTARLRGYQDQVWEVDVTAGSTAAHKFELEKVTTQPTAPPPAAANTQTTRPTPTSVYIGLAATGALAVGAGVTGFLALGKNSDYEAANEARSSDAESLRDDTQTFNLVTDILIGGAVVGAAVTSYLYFTRPEVPVTPKDTAIRFAPTVGTHGGGAVVWGQF